VTETVNDSDWNAYETEDPNKHEVTDEEITPSEDTDHSSFELDIVLQPKRGQRENITHQCTQIFIPYINQYFLGSQE
jgi:hypothetical protein